MLYVDGDISNRSSFIPFIPSLVCCARWDVLDFKNPMEDLPPAELYSHCFCHILNFPSHMHYLFSYKCTAQFISLEPTWGCIWLMHPFPSLINGRYCIISTFTTINFFLCWIKFQKISIVNILLLLNQELGWPDGVYFSADLYP